MSSSRNTLTTSIREHRLCSMWLRTVALEIGRSNFKVERDERRQSLPSHMRLPVPCSHSVIVTRSVSTADLDPVQCNSSNLSPTSINGHNHSSSLRPLSLFAWQPRTYARLSFDGSSIISNDKSRLPITAAALGRYFGSRTISLPCTHDTNLSDQLSHRHLLHAIAFTTNAGRSLHVRQLRSISSKTPPPLDLPSSEPKDKPIAFSRITFTRSQKVALLCILCIQFVFNGYLSILPPFFPSNAARNGLDELQCSFVFSISPAISVAITPFLGSWLSRFGSRPLLVIGLTLNASAIMLFGTFHHLPSPWMYLTFCLFCRSIEAIGTCMHSTANYLYVLQLFPRQVAFVFGLLETFIGLGKSNLHFH
jgi:hypothetical protein